MWWLAFAFYVVMLLVSWGLIAERIYKSDPVGNAAFAAYMGGVASLVWPATLGGLLVMEWLERPRRDPPLPKPPAQGPFR
jgi:hypothetical protein